MSKPIHPATVHFPIAFLSLAWGIDILYGITTKLAISPLKSALSSSLPDLARASHYLQALGLITMVPALASGIQQLLTMQKFDSNKAMLPKFKLTLAHAATNDIVLAAAAYSWYIRKENLALVPGDLNLMISAVLLPFMLFSASLGGTLVYNHGMGINLSKKAKTG